MKDVNTNSQTESLEFNLPTALIKKLKKLSKIRGHSFNDELTEAIKNHLDNENDIREPSLNKSTTDTNISNLQEALDKEATVAIKNHLKKHKSS